MRMKLLGNWEKGENRVWVGDTRKGENTMCVGVGVSRSAVKGKEENSIMLNWIEQRGGRERTERVWVWVYECVTVCSEGRRKKIAYVELDRGERGKGENRVCVGVGVSLPGNARKEEKRRVKGKRY